MEGALSLRTDTTERLAPKGGVLVRAEPELGEQRVGRPG